MSIMMDLNFNEKDFNLESSMGLVLVIFLAEWCGPCKMLTPFLKEIYQEKNIEIYTVDVDKNPETIGKFNIKSVPTLIFFVDGKFVDQMVGYKDKDEILEKIDMIKNGKI